MKKVIVLFCLIALVVLGCNKNETTNKIADHTTEKNNTTELRVYHSKWNGNPLIVKKKDEHSEYVTVNEITDASVVDRLIENLKNADWEEDIDVDILPENYHFTWNGFTHGMWVNEEYERIEVIIAGQSNYGVLSTASSEIVLEIITGEAFSFIEENSASNTY